MSREHVRFRLGEEIAASHPSAKIQRDLCSCGVARIPRLARIHAHSHTHTHTCTYAPTIIKSIHQIHILKRTQQRVHNRICAGGTGAGCWPVSSEWSCCCWQSCAMHLSRRAHGDSAHVFDGVGIDRRGSLSDHHHIKLSLAAPRGALQGEPHPCAWFSLQHRHYHIQRPVDHGTFVDAQQNVPHKNAGPCRRGASRHIRKLKEIFQRPNCESDPTLALLVHEGGRYSRVVSDGTRHTHTHTHTHTHIYKHILTCINTGRFAYPTRCSAPSGPSSSGRSRAKGEVWAYRI